MSDDFRIGMGETVASGDEALLAVGVSPAELEQMRGCKIPDAVIEAYYDSFGPGQCFDFAELVEFATRFTPTRKNRRGRPRGYADWRPQHKTRVLLDQVEEILEEYSEHLPLTVRQVFYRLVGAYGYDKTENAYERLCEKLVRARRGRLIPFDHIRDDGVVRQWPTWFSSQESFWDMVGESARAYRRDRQAGQRQSIELWCEAAGMMSQLSTVAHPFSIPVYSAGGFTSLTAVRHIVDRATARTKPTLILHVGDCDPSGESIFNAMIEDAQAFMIEDAITGIERVDGVRVALTADQVAEHDLPTSPPKKTDSRSGRWSGETCQLEALPPDTLADVVHGAIVEHINLDRVAQELDTEKHDRTALLRALPAGDQA